MVLDLAFHESATFAALPPKASGANPATNWALGMYLAKRDN